MMKNFTITVTIITIIACMFIIRSTLLAYGIRYCYGRDSELIIYVLLHTLFVYCFDVWSLKGLIALKNNLFKYKQYMFT